MAKDRKLAGADNQTPSIPQYFSWVNNTNEGATEKQTLINLDYFKYMKETYGMQIKLYAWDAGNFDGAGRGYGNLDGEKFKSQYPEGYKNIVAKADSIGIHMGLWGSPDGYGDTPEEEKKRYDFMVHLCRDYHFGQFKIDGVCGNLRPEKAALYAKMLKECREYVPELIVNNHRLNLYEAEDYVTTFLWEGVETYIDVHVANSRPAMHNREYMFERGHVPGLERLAEDHGVCVSSALDYFEDDLIYQAFGRCLILAPELYGNPWFLRDSEQPRLARIYNLHSRNGEILVNGMELDKSYGCDAVSRGSGSKRFITTGNNTWEKKTITVNIDETIGLTKKGRYKIILRHPYDGLLGEYEYGDKAEVELMPFRAALIEISHVDEKSPVIPGIFYDVIREDAEGNPVEYRLLKNDRFDVREKAPVYLGSLDDIALPEDNEYLYEKAMYAATNDSLEYRCVLRSGESSVPEIKAATDAFFEQKTYKLRGCDAVNMFDGNPDSFFDSQSRSYCGADYRIYGGCLRVDFGGEYAADEIEIIAYAPKENTRELPPQLYPEYAEYSSDLKNWKTSDRLILDDMEKYTQEVVRFSIHDTYFDEGKKQKFVYPVNGKVRYIRIAEPMDRIFSVRLFKNGEEVEVNTVCSGNNMQAHYLRNKPVAAKKATVTIPEYNKGSYLAVGFPGEHGCEGVCCVIEYEGKTVGTPKRAPEFVANMWEHRVLMTDGNYTYYFTLPEGMEGKKVSVTALVSTEKGKEVKPEIYLCDFHK